MKLAGVLGDPVSHSLSPKLHNYWIKQLGLDANYLALHVKADQLAEKFRTLPGEGYRGWNITVPHKEAALALVDELDEAAKKIGAVNTVVVKADGKLLGRNTDAAGFLNNIRSNVTDLSPYQSKALVLGAGGAARGVCYALKNAGFKKIIVVNRTRERAEALAADMGIDAAAWEETGRELGDTAFLANTTSLGMQGQPPLLMPLNALPKEALVTDIVYKPLETELLKQARAKGCITVTGIGMLIHQAVPGFKAWFGVEPKVTPDLERMLLS